MSLFAGLSIVERFNHFVDIYSDETRYSPLGMDATVVYPQKDLIIKNPYHFPLRFEFKITDIEFVVLLRCAGRIEINGVLRTYIKEMQGYGRIINNNPALFSLKYILLSSISIS